MKRATCFSGEVLGRLLRKPLTWIVVGALALAGGVGLYWFQPWKLVVDRSVSEAAPEGAVLAEGAFIAHEHATTGTARLLELPGGRRILVLADLDTSNGPDLRVWITDRVVIEGRDGWEVFDDGRYVELGRLKGNKGTQRYDVPADLDLGEFRSVSIWCKRFSVSFGAAPLAAV